MSDEKLKRRRFLADLLFAGGALTAAALVANQALAKDPKPTPTPKSPSPRPTEAPHPAGAPLPPKNPDVPIVKGEMKAPRQQPGIRGEAVAPRARPSKTPSAHIDGDVAAPREGKPPK